MSLTEGSVRKEDLYKNLLVVESSGVPSGGEVDSA